MRGDRESCLEDDLGTAAPDLSALLSKVCPEPWALKLLEGDLGVWAVADDEPERPWARASSLLRWYLGSGELSVAYASSLV
jgi:hypothetical protein